jgi:hypothetical protein
VERKSAGRILLDFFCGCFSRHLSVVAESTCFATWSKAGLLNMCLLTLILLRTAVRLVSFGTNLSFPSPALGSLCAFRRDSLQTTCQIPLVVPGRLTGNLLRRIQLSLTLIIRQSMQWTEFATNLYPASTIVSMSARRCSDVDETSATDAIGR